MTLKLKQLAIVSASLGMLSSAPVNALGISPFTFGVGLVSLTATAVTGVSSGVVIVSGVHHSSGTATTVGVGMAAGTLLMGIADPAAAFFYSGEFTYHYDPALLRVVGFGWLGDWGADPSLPPPPTDSTALLGTIVNLQPPGARLFTTTTNDESAGLLRVTFDWGASGHEAGSTDPFNFAAALFETQSALRLQLLPFDGSTAVHRINSLRRTSSSVASSCVAQPLKQTFASAAAAALSFGEQRAWMHRTRCG